VSEPWSTRQQGQLSYIHFIQTANGHMHSRHDKNDLGAAGMGDVVAQWGMW
jgi:hypothetical protein